MNPAVLKRHLFDIQQRYGRGALGQLRLAAAGLARLAGRPASALSQALAAHRLLYTPAAFRSVLRNLPALQTDGDALVSRDVERKEASIRTIVLRWPTLQAGAAGTAAIVEKGILVITFTKVSSYYYRNTNIDLLARYFHIVLEPSWSGYMDADILFWTTKTREPVFVQSSEIRDRVALECLCSNLVPISIGASDWVDHRNFTPLEREKKYDSIYVANTSPVKRIHVYLKAIRKIVREYDPNYQGVLVCAAWGGKATEIQGLIDHYGVGGNCKLQLSLTQAELSELLSACKVNVLMSLKEGSNRSLFESMFCNLPVIALADNIGVNKSYINEYTGALIYEDRLSEVLLHMAAHWRQYQPRRWALKNISPEATTAKLLEIIAARTGEVPVEGSRTFIKINNPEVSYLEYPGVSTEQIAGPLIDAFSLQGLCDINHEITRFQSEFMLRITTGKASDSKAGSKL